VYQAQRELIKFEKSEGELAQAKVALEQARELEKVQHVRVHGMISMQHVMTSEVHTTGKPTKEAADVQTDTAVPFHEEGTVAANGEADKSGRSWADQFVANLDSENDHHLLIDAGAAAAFLTVDTPVPTPAATTPSGLCTPGKYFLHLAGNGVSGCYLCPSGKFQPAMGASSCLMCAAGQYLDNYGQKACSKCPLGKYQRLVGKLSCKESPDTPVPTPQPAVGHCPEGTWARTLELGSGLGGVLHCYPCHRGRYQPKPSQPSCLNCPLGKYSDVAQMVRCKVCLAYKKLPQYHAHPDGEVSCRHLTFLQRADAAEARAITAAAFQKEHPLKAVNDCPDGKWALENKHNVKGLGFGDDPNEETEKREDDQSIEATKRAQVQAEEIKAGQLAGEARAYQEEEVKAASPRRRLRAAVHHSNINSVERLEAGHLQRLQLTPAKAPVFTCYLCPAGQFQHQSKQISCLACSPGKYAKFYGAKRCHNCPAGKQQLRTGQSRCDANRATLEARLAKVEAKDQAAAAAEAAKLAASRANIIQSCGIGEFLSESVR
jgi:hypothetical protein